ncbi:tetratricopeptide repeat protein [Synechococcus sp. H60.3]|uniref:tetratricopeptide repeat protein n=1 Tax=Synechococcus sp. H60.3 TaxID=2967124 RepID=UPI0039C3052B
MPQGFGRGKSDRQTAGPKGLGRGSALPPCPSPEATLALAERHRQAGDLETALHLCRQLTRAHPHLFAAQALLGSLYLQMGDPCQALTPLQLALHLRRDWVPAWQELGDAWMLLGNPEEAAHAYEQGLAFAPADGQLLFRLGSCWLALGKREQAIAVLRQAAAAQPPQVYALATLGNALLFDNQLGEAEAWFRRALALAPQEGRILVNLGHCLHLQDRLEEAADCLRRAIPLLPEDAQPHNNLGTVLQEQNQLEAAIEAYRRGLQLAPDWPEIHYNLGTALLTLGRYEEGWREYEWRLQRQGAAYPHLLSPLWPGSPLGQQTLLVYAEQGLGDTIQFVRYLPLLAAAHPAAQIFFRCQGSLVELVQAAFPQVQVISERDPLPPFDWHLPLLSLPHRLGTTLETIPNRIPYLVCPDCSSAWPEDWPEVAQRGIKVGLVWASGRRATPELNRVQRLKSCPLDLLLQHLHLPDVQWVSLQVGEDLSQWAPLLEQHQVMELGSRFRSFVDTAAAVAQLDLVISVDTAVAHLAGAMGKPVWVLLPFAADWRWLLQQQDSPWYPGMMRLFRQEARGNWVGPLQQMRRALEELLRGIPSYSSPFGTMR